MKKIIAIGLSTLALSFPVLAEKASSESVRDLMLKTGAGDLSVQMMNQMLPALKQMIPEAPETFWQDVMKKVDGNEIINMTIPIYQKYLTQSDIDAINKFYDSPAGRKMIKAQPAIMQESMMIGQQWGQQLARDVLSEYEARK